MHDQEVERRHWTRRAAQDQRHQPTDAGYLLNGNRRDRPLRRLQTYGRRDIDMPCEERLARLRIRYDEQVESIERQRRFHVQQQHSAKNAFQRAVAMLELCMDSGIETVRLDDVKTVCKQMEALAFVYDEMARLAWVGGTAEKLPVAPLLQTLVAKVQTDAPGRTIRFDCHADVSLWLKQIASLYPLAVEMLENAIKHGGGLIEVMLIPKDGRVRLVVRNLVNDSLEGTKGSPSGGIGQGLARAFAYDLRGEYKIWDSNAATDSIPSKTAEVEFPFDN